MPGRIVQEPTALRVCLSRSVGTRAWQEETVPGLLDGDVGARGEGKARFCAVFDVLFAGGRGTRGSGSGTGSRTDGRSLAAASQSADERARGCSSADEAGIALTFAFFG